MHVEELNNKDAIRRNKTTPAVTATIRSKPANFRRPKPKTTKKTRIPRTRQRKPAPKAQKGQRGVRNRARRGQSRQTRSCNWAG